MKICDKVAVLIMPGRVSRFWPPITIFMDPSSPLASMFLHEFTLKIKAKMKFGVWMGREFFLWREKKIRLIEFLSRFPKGLFTSF